MTGLRDFLRKRERLKGGHESSTRRTPNLPEVTIMRSDTHTQEILNPPSFPLENETPSLGQSSVRDGLPPRERRSSTTSASSRSSRGESRLSSILHFRSPSRDKEVSMNVPVDLPPIAGDADANPTEMEAQWEERATILAQGNPSLGSGRDSRRGSLTPSKTSISDARGDDDIQEAIRLHESGDLKRATAMFGRLANPTAANNALAQVLYGLALRHGWGIEVDLERAVTYLSRAAQNSSLVESQALSSGMKKGGAAKGELVLAIFELGNCFRSGWGVEKDPVAARSYYETAANCGDTDAMIEVARCYEEGIGVKRDKFKAASYYRRAERGGNRLVGNSWIWKDKYNSD